MTVLAIAGALVALAAVVQAIRLGVVRGDWNGALLIAGLIAFAFLITWFSEHAGAT